MNLDVITHEKYTKKWKRRKNVLFYLYVFDAP